MNIKLARIDRFIIPEYWIWLDEFIIQKGSPLRVYVSYKWKCILEEFGFSISGEGNPYLIRGDYDRVTIIIGSRQHSSIKSAIDV